MLLNYMKKINLLMKNKFENTKNGVNNEMSTRFNPPDMNAKSNEAIIETLEQVHEGVDRIKTASNPNNTKIEFEFMLPRGYIDLDGNLHRTGKMRLARASDEILPLKDSRVQQNPAYLQIILISRVITSLGTIENINPALIENLFISDLEYLQEFYNKINGKGSQTCKMVCPKCKQEFDVEPITAGEL